MPREPHRVIGDMSAQTSLLQQGDIILTEQIHRRRHERTISKLRLLWERRRVLLQAAVLGLFLSLVVAFLIPSRYESTTQLMPPDQSEGVGGVLASLLGKTGEGGGGAAGGIAGIAGDLLGLKSSGELFVGVLGSRTVQDDIIGKFGLRKVYGVNTWEAARLKLKDRTNVSSDRKSGIITIKVDDRSPERAAAIAQEYVTELNRVVTTLNTSSAHRERVFLEGRLAEVKEDLESAEKSFSDFSSKNTAINITEQGKAMIAAAADLEGQLMAAQTQLESLRQIYTDNNVRVREVQARVDELHRQMGQLGGKAGAQPAPSGNDSESAFPTIRQLPVLGVTYADLYRREKVEEAVFEGLTQEYELAKVQEAKETPSVKVLDPADVPEKKSYPPRGVMALIGMIIAVAFGTIWILAENYWQNVEPDNPGKVFATEVLGDVRSGLPWRSPNGSIQASPNGSDWERLARRAITEAKTSGKD
jgi:capsule polysaccharide export protein KpsE/RkpR